ncbi:hypothetical protein CPC08DRAFT_813479 [Agrocybe pediades]|nr:hypothetical protein CPC08DRAFT_813479 [Agrocybe pediades]
MSEHLPHPLPHVRRIVTSHDDSGNAIILSDSDLPSQAMEIVRDGRSSAIWVTTDSVPTNDNNNQEDGRKRIIEDMTNFKLVHPNGTNLRSTELGPGAITPMHRTCSLDYNILVAGELVLINEDGTEKHLKNPGDVVIQRGTMHAWRNPTNEWARWITVLIAANPVVINEKQLEAKFVL